MGTKVQNLPGYYSMRDLNEGSSSCGWPLFYGDKTPTNGKYYDNYLPSATTDACSVHDKDVVKRMMVEHEAIFKNQVYELHRLYRIQRDLMNDFKRKELHRNQIPIEASFCTGPLTSQITTKDGRKWHASGFPVGNTAYVKTSVSGAAGVHSPLGSIQGISNQAGLFPSPDGCSLKDVEVLKSTRPSKVRRKMFDLSLPADEYVDSDESEKLSDEKTSGSTLFLPDRSCKNGKEDDVKQSLRRRTGLADLNEPVKVDETYDSPYVHIPSNSSAATECIDLTASAKQKLQFFGSSREHFLNSRQGTDSWARNNGYLENNGNGKGAIPSAAESGHAKSNLQPMSQFLKLEKPLLSSQTMQHTYSKAHEPASDYLDGRNKADTWREKTVGNVHVSERNHEYFVNKHPESLVPLHRPGLIPVAPSSDLSKSWSHSAASWGMASCSLSHKLMSVQTPSCLNASGSINRNLEDFWALNINSKPNPGLQCDAPLRQGFYPGSSSGSKEPSINMSSISYDYLNHNNDSKLIREHFINNDSTKYHKGSNSNCNDKKFGKDIDLNVILSNGLYNNSLVPQSTVGIMDGDALSWLRAKTTLKNEVQNTNKICITAGETSFLQTASLSTKGEIAKGPNGKFMQTVTLVSCSNNNEQRRTEVSESSTNKKILGVPIFDMPRISPKKSLSSITSPLVLIRTPSDAEAVENKQKHRIFDINLPCDDNDLEFDKEEFTETVVSKTRSSTAEADSRNQIDLNLSMSEDEGSFTTIPSVANTKMRAEIDLEAPAAPESDEDLIPKEKQLETCLLSPQVPQDHVEQPHDELMKSAAEAIVVLSSTSRDQVHAVINSTTESSMVDPLSWFVEVVSSCKDNLETECYNLSGKDGGDTKSLDYFESMTLLLEETKEEDYMPKPLVPENIKMEEATTTLPTRTRKGPARRGRQKKDFQRDILPGLVSLSRNEVTEDIQAFGGIMRATGYSWQSGLTRRSSTRNGCGRGRRRAQVTPSPSPPLATNEIITSLPQQLNNIEVALEDRSLTGWGKTTRRPRRQRCPPAGNNPPLIPIT